MPRNMINIAAIRRFPQRWWRYASAVLGVGLLMTFAACGGDSSDVESNSGKPLAGKTIGFSVQLQANATLNAIGEGLTAEVTREGGEVEIMDAQGDPEKQLTDIKQLISQGVDALVVHPAAWESVRGALRQAERDDIPVIAHDAIFGDAVSAEDLKPVQIQINEGRATQAAEAVELLTADGAAKNGIVAMTFCPNPPTHEYLMQQVSDNIEAAGAELLDTVCNPTDDSSGAFTVARQALTRFGSADAFYAYNDTSAIGIAKAAARDGREDMVITGYNAEPQGIAAVRRGEIQATWDYRQPEIGQMLGRAVRMILSGEGENLPTTVTVKPQMITEDNVADFIPWDERIADIEAGEYIGVPLNSD